jgi:SAM-dependent methyltransferase
MNPAEFANIAKAEQSLWWYRGMNRILFRLLDPIARERTFKRVLEAGCGTGYLSKLLHERYSWPMFPVDLGAEGLRYARGMDVERPVQADVGALPFSDCAFDLVICMDVIVHFPKGEESRAFHEISRVLAKSGLCVIRLSALDVLRSRHSQFAHERQRFTKARLLQNALDAGLEPLRCTYANTLLSPVAFLKFRIWEPLTRQALASGVEPVSPWLDSLLYTPLAIESAWLGAGLNYPIGQSLILIARKKA